jgi:hypothetical protein
VRIRGKGRPKGTLRDISRITESSTRRNPSSWELPNSSVPPVLNRPKSLTEQLFVINSKRNRLISIVFILFRLDNKYIDTYKPGTLRERGYISSILSIYKNDYIEDSVTVITTAIKRDIIRSIKVFSQDAELELDDDFE